MGWCLWGGRDLRLQRLLPRGSLLPSLHLYQLFIRIWQSWLDVCKRYKLITLEYWCIDTWHFQTNQRQMWFIWWSYKMFLQKRGNRSLREIYKILKVDIFWKLQQIDIYHSFPGMVFLSTIHHFVALEWTRTTLERRQLTAAVIETPNLILAMTKKSAFAKAVCATLPPKAVTSFHWSFSS